MSMGNVLIAAGLMLGTYFALRPKKKRGTGLNAAEDCSTWQITDAAQTKALSEQVYASFVKSGDLDPWDISDAIVERVAPQCHTSGEEMRSIREVELYKTIFIETMNRLFAEKRIDEDMYAIYKDEIEAFMIEQVEKLETS